jgi:hypothetical protein
MKTYTLEEVQNELLGKKGTPRRDQFEYELQIPPPVVFFTNGLSLIVGGKHTTMAQRK